MRVEVFNFKDKHAQEIFKEITSDTGAFTNCFKYMQPLLKQAKRWMDTVKAHCKKAFQLIRIKTHNIKPSGANKLITHRNKLLKQGTTDTSSIDAKIAEIISKEGMEKCFHVQKIHRLKYFRGSI